MQGKRRYLLLVVLCTLVLASTISGVPNAAASSHVQSKWTTAFEVDQALDAPPTQEPPPDPGGTPPDDNWDGVAPVLVAPQEAEPAAPLADRNLAPDASIPETPGLGDSEAAAASESLLFPATGDVINVEANPYWWHAGDYAQGVRTLGLNSVAAVKYDLTITNNVLNAAGHVDLELSINGIVVGSFTVLPGETSRSVTFFFPPISGPSYTIQLQETNTVDPGAGSVVIPLDASPIRLIPPTPPPNDDFANAAVIGGLPFSEAVDNTYATTESGEPQPCYYSNNTIWYTFTPSQNMWLRVDLGGGQYESALTVYRANGPNIWDLSYIWCGGWGPAVELQVEAGVTYYLQAGSIYGPGTLQINVQQLPPPENDNFAAAKLIGSLPFSEGLDTVRATTESDEPIPSCHGSIYRSVWYAFTPAMSGPYTVWVREWSVRVLAIYTGDSLPGLTEIGCRTIWGGGRLTFQGDTGTTYYIQVGSLWDDGGWLNFSLDVAPPPEARFGWSPGDPSAFDAVYFYNDSYDPAEVGIETSAWDFGDGATSADWSPSHQYAQDGDYTVSLTVTTYDGRTASIAQTVPVWTHDVAITRLAAPNAAKSGQTRAINVVIKNTRYPERVHIELLKSVPGGYQFVASTEQNIPVRSGGRTTSVSLSYTFAPDDATMGKVTFKATAGIMDHRDALPADNEAISSPTKVSR